MKAQDIIDSCDEQTVLVDLNTMTALTDSVSKDTYEVIYERGRRDMIEEFKRWLNE